MSDFSKICDLIDTDDSAWTHFMEFAPESVFGDDLIETENNQFSNDTRPSEVIDNNTGASDTRPFHLIGNDNGVSPFNSSPWTDFMEFAPDSAFGGDLIETEEIQFSNGTHSSGAIDNNTGASDTRPFHLIGNDNGVSRSFNSSPWPDFMEFAPESVFGGDLIEREHNLLSNDFCPSDAIDNNTGASDTYPFHLIGNDNGVSGSPNRRVTGSVESNFMQYTPGSVLDVVTLVDPQSPRSPSSDSSDIVFLGHVYKEETPYFEPVDSQTPRSPSSVTRNSSNMFVDTPADTHNEPDYYEWAASKPTVEIDDFDDEGDIAGSSGCNPYLESIMCRGLPSATENNKGSRGNSIGSSGYNPLLESIRHGAGSPTYTNNGFHGDLRRSDMGLSATHGVFVADRALHRSGNGLSAATNSNGTSAFSRSGSFATVRAHQGAPNTPQKRRFPSIDPTLPRQPRQVSVAGLLALMDEKRTKSKKVPKCGATPAKKAKSAKRPEESDDFMDYKD